ncbi:hypothetical protein PIB30_115776, partial [Stylosanthes scabra]|nr:hypothetical protein [Stylosanthes scabra]
MLGWQTQPEGRSTSDRATHPTPRAPAYLRGMGLHGRAQSQAERMSRHGRAMEMLEQHQGITRSCPMGTCSGPAGHHGTEPRLRHRAPPD